MAPKKARETKVREVNVRDVKVRECKVLEAKVRKPKKISSKDLDLLKINTMSKEAFKEWGRVQEEERLANENGPTRATKRSEWVNVFNFDQIRMTPWRVRSSKMKKIGSKRKNIIAKQLKKDNRKKYEYRLDETKGYKGLKTHYSAQKLTGLVAYFPRGFVLGSSTRLEHCRQTIFQYLLGHDVPEQEAIVEANSKENHNVVDFPVRKVTNACYYRKASDGSYREWYEMEYKPMVILKEKFGTISFPIEFREKLWEAFKHFKDEEKKKRENVSTSEVSPKTSTGSSRTSTSFGSSRPLSNAVKEQSPKSNRLTDTALNRNDNNKPKISPIRIVIVQPKAVLESLPNNSSPKQVQDLTKVKWVDTDSSPKDDFVQTKSISSTSEQVIKQNESNQLKAKKERILRGIKSNSTRKPASKTSNKKPRINKSKLFVKSLDSYNHLKSQTKKNLVKPKENSAQTTLNEVAVKTIDYPVLNKRSENENREVNLDKQVTEQIASFSNDAMACTNESMVLDEAVKSIHPMYQFTKPSEQQENRNVNSDIHTADMCASFPNPAITWANELQEAHQAIQNMLADEEAPISSLEQSQVSQVIELQNMSLVFAEPSPMMAQSLVSVPLLVDNILNEDHQRIDTPTIEHAAEPVTEFVKSEIPFQSIGSCLDKNVLSSTMRLAENDRIGQKDVDASVINKPIKQTQTRENNILAKAFEEFTFKNEHASDPALPEHQKPQVDQNIGNPEISCLLSYGQANHTVQTQTESIQAVPSGSFAVLNPTLQPEAVAALMNYQQTMQVIPQVGLGIHGQSQSLNMVQNPATIPNYSVQQVLSGNRNPLGNDGFMQKSSRSWSLAQNAVQRNIPSRATNYQSGQNMTTTSIPNQSGHSFWHENVGFIQGSEYGSTNCTFPPQMAAPLMNNPLQGYRPIDPRPIAPQMQYPVWPDQNQPVGGHLDRYNNVMGQGGPYSNFVEPNRFRPTHSNVPATQRQTPMIGQYWNSHGMNGPVLARAETIRHEPGADYIRLAMNRVYGLDAWNHCNAIQVARSLLHDKLGRPPVDITSAMAENERIKKEYQLFVYNIQNGVYKTRTKTNVEHNRQQFAGPMLQIPTVSSSTVGHPMQMNSRVTGTAMFNCPQGQINLGSSAVPQMQYQSKPACMNYGATGNVAPSPSAVQPMGLQSPSNAAGTMMMYPRTQNVQAAAGVAAGHGPYTTVPQYTY